MLVSIEKVHKDLNQLKESQLEILNLGGAGDENIPPRLKSRKKTKLKIAAGIGSLAAITGLGSTLAASISLNSGQPVEFGQGVATTAACDADGITITPTSEYVPTSESFRLDTIQLSGINTATPDADTGIGCAGKTLIVRAYTDDSDYQRFTVDENTSNPLYFTHFVDTYTGGTGTNYYNDGIAISLDQNGDIYDVYVSRSNEGEDTDDVTYGSGSAGSVDVYFGQRNTGWDENYSDFVSSTNYGLDSRAVSKFTVESVDEIDTNNDWYDVDTLT